MLLQSNNIHKELYYQFNDSRYRYALYYLCG